jgi:polysaccharide export outer membrane protein
MKTLASLIATGVWILLTASSSAQMSTFPAPPPLAPPTDHSPAQAAEVSASGASTPDAMDPAQLSVAKPATAPASTPASTTNAAPVAPAIPVTAATLSSMSALDDKVALEAGDSISFRVIEDRDDAVPRVVTDTGEVDFPYIGRVKVAGKTCHQVAVEVKKLLEVDYYKQATVIVGLDLIVGQDKTKPHDMAWIVGQVRTVGPQELSKAQPMTVSQIVMRAGGFGDFADQRRVKLIHRSATATGELADVSDIKDAQVIDVKSVFDGKSTVDPVVRAGDYIIVSKQWVNF